MGRSLFLRIFNAITMHGDYFVQRRNGIGKLELSGLQKVTAVFRMLAYGVLADATDEYIKIAWGGQYAGRSGSPTIILEAVVDYDLWIWHAYFGLPGSNNDINVLEASHLFANLTEGIALPANYVIKGKSYNMGYYLADDIYPKWSTLVQKDERDVNAAIEERVQVSSPEVELVGDDNVRFQESLARHRKIKDKEAHIELRNALIEHLCDEYTNS
uniref:Uncharacterized protein n=1 Tax=Cannabis sativa TaxID=3483 RepID=A0A803QC24_CANSA